MSSRKLLAAAVTTVAASALVAGPARAAGVDQTVAGTATSTIAISVGTPVVFAGFTPGETTTSTGGTLAALSTSPNWTLQAKGNGTSGKLDSAGGPGCAGSTPTLASAPALEAAPAVDNPSITATPITLTATNQTVASATAVPLAATVFRTTFDQAIDGSELLKAGCVYSETVSYTLQ